MLNMDDTPDILRNDGQETITSRLAWKVKPEPSFQLNDGNGYQPVKFETIAIDLFNMQQGYMKWIEGSDKPLKQLKLVTEPAVRHPDPSDQLWKECRSTIAYSEATKKKMFFDTDARGGIMGLDDCLKQFVEYCRNFKMSLAEARQHYAVFLYTGSKEVKFKTGFSTYMPVFKISKHIPINQNESVGEVQQNNITKFKNEVQL